MLKFYGGDMKTSRTKTIYNRMMRKDRDQIAEAYKSEPWWYDVRGFFILTFAYNSTIGTQLKFFGSNFGDHHLEVACGTGTLLKMMIKWRERKGLSSGKVVGVDYAQSMLAGARQRFKDNRNVAIVHADAAQLPYDANTFDTANIANSIHCFPTVDAALVDILRVLKPGGTLAANVLLYPQGVAPLKKIAEKINVWGMKKGILYKPFRKEDVEDLLVKSGFEIGTNFVSGNTWNVIAKKPLK